MISSGRPSVSRFGVTNTATPSGRSTRATSASTRSGSGTCSIDWTDSTASKLPPGNGSARMSATTVSRSWPASAAASTSTPTVSRGASRWKLWPTPQPRSSTRPGPSSGSASA